MRLIGTFGFGFGTKPTQTTQSAYREIFMSVDISCSMIVC